MKHLFYYLFALSFLFTSCKDKDVTPEGDYLIFGHHSGFCITPQCLSHYKLTDSQLYKDQKVNNLRHQSFDFILQKDEDFQKVKTLASALPAQLLSLNSQSFGCPNCYDQGELFIQYHTNGETKS